MLSRPRFLALGALVLSSGLLTAGCTVPPAAADSSRDALSQAAARLVTRGGDATTGDAGDGGNITFRMLNQRPGAHGRIVADGTVDASFPAPTLPRYNGGPIPLVVDEDLTIASYADASAGLASGDAYFLTRAPAQLVANVDGAAQLVTGLDVARGRTLTLAANEASDVEHRAGMARFTLANDLRNAGTITTPRLADGKSAVGFFVEAASFYGLPGSAIRVVGANAPGDSGGNGGTAAVLARHHNYNQGDIIAHGGDGAVGGSGGEIFLTSRVPGPDAPEPDLVNTGALVTRGGAGGVGDGGNGGMIQLRADYGDVHNSGEIDLSGGAGMTAGGPASGLYLIADYFGAVRNTGAVNARGGRCSAPSCDGGPGGNVIITSHGNGDLLWNAPIFAMGADGKGEGTGGFGGTAMFHAFQGNRLPDRTVTPAGSVAVAGDLLLNGGAGAIGAPGGQVELQVDAGRLGGVHQAVLVGYPDVDQRGGHSEQGTDGQSGGVR